MDNFGVSFSPLQPDQGVGGGGQNPYGGAPASPVQDAIKILSLRLPRVVGASGVAPMGLLNSPGGSLFGGGSLEALLRHIFGQRAQAGPFGSMPGPTMPAPSPIGVHPPNPSVVFNPPGGTTPGGGVPPTPGPLGPPNPLTAGDRGKGSRF